MEVRFEDVCAHTTVPQAETGGGLFTVGGDIKSKARVCPCFHCLHHPKLLHTSSSCKVQLLHMQKRHIRSCVGLLLLFTFSCWKWHVYLRCSVYFTSCPSGSSPLAAEISVPSGIM